MPSKPSQTIKVRTGELLVIPGFWWAINRSNGDTTIVKISGTGFDNDLMVAYFGNDQIYFLSEAIEHYEILALIPDPF